MNRNKSTFKQKVQDFKDRIRRQQRQQRIREMRRINIQNQQKMLQLQSQAQPDAIPESISSFQHINLFTNRNVNISSKFNIQHVIDIEIKRQKTCLCNIGQGTNQRNSNGKFTDVFQHKQIIAAKFLKILRVNDFHFQLSYFDFLLYYKSQNLYNSNHPPSLRSLKRWIDDYQQI